MRTIALHIILIQAFLCCVSCEKDFVYDEDCIANPGGNTIPPWNNGIDTTVVNKPDSTNKGFEITINEWGDTIINNITL